MLGLSYFNRITWLLKMLFYVQLKYYVLLGLVVVGVLNETNLGRSEHAVVELEAGAVDVDDGAGLLALLGDLEERLVLVGVELLVDGVDLHDSVLGQGLLEHTLHHGDTVVELLDVLAADLEGLLGQGTHRQVEVINALNEVLGELLESKRLLLLHLLLGGVLEVAELSNRALVGILELGALLVLVLELGLPLVLLLRRSLTLSGGILGGTLLALGLGGVETGSGGRKGAHAPGGGASRRSGKA